MAKKIHIIEKTGGGEVKHTVQEADSSQPPRTVKEAIQHLEATCGVVKKLKNKKGVDRV